MTKLATKLSLPLLVLPLVLPLGCNKEGGANGATERQESPTGADNTRMNDRDKGSSLTPVDQGNNQADLNTTQAIRKSLMADDTLSVDAKNVKIVTGNGAITLRGPVKTEAERKTIEAKAQQFAGTNRVENRLEVESNQ